MESVADTAVIAAVKVLHDAGCLVEPTPPPPTMTLDEAAVVVIRRARTPRLEADDPADVASVVNVRPQYEFAWASAVRAGVDPADTDLHTARQVLAKHHGLL